MENKTAVRIPVLFAEMVADVHEITDKIRTKLNRIGCDEFESTMGEIKKRVNELYVKHRSLLGSEYDGKKMKQLFTPNVQLLKRILFKVLAKLRFELSRKVFDMVLSECEIWYTIKDPESELSKLIQCAIRLENMVILDNQTENNSNFESNDLEKMTKLVYNPSDEEKQEIRLTFLKALDSIYRIRISIKEAIPIEWLCPTPIKYKFIENKLAITICQCEVDSYERVLEGEAPLPPCRLCKNRTKHEIKEIKRLGLEVMEILNGSCVNDV